MNLTKNLAFATNYHIIQRKLNFVAIFAHNFVTATEKQNNLQKITTDWEGSCILTANQGPNLLFILCTHRERRRQDHILILGRSGGLLGRSGGILPEKKKLDFRCLKRHFLHCGGT